MRDVARAYETVVTFLDEDQAAPDAESRIRQELRERYDVEVLETGADPAVVRATLVGMATSLRARAWSEHLGAGVSLSGSSLRRNVCQLLFGIPPNITGRPTRQKVTTEQAAAIRDWLLACELSWLPRATVLEADQLERRRRATYLPELNRV